MTVQGVLIAALVTYLILGGISWFHLIGFSLALYAIYVEAGRIA